MIPGQPQPGPAPAPVISTLNRTGGDGNSLEPYIIAAFVASLIMMLVLLFYWGSVANREKNMAVSLAEKKQEYVALNSVENKIFEIKDLVTGLDVAYAAQVPFDKLLTLVEKTSTNTTKYQSVSISQEGVVTLAGSVSTYNDFAKLVKSFRGEPGDGASLTDQVKIASAAQSMVSTGSGETAGQAKETKFNLSFKIRPTLFTNPDLTAEVKKGLESSGSGL